MIPSVTRHASCHTGVAGRIIDVVLESGLVPKRRRLAIGDRHDATFVRMPGEARCRRRGLRTCGFPRLYFRSDIALGIADQGEYLRVARFETYHARKIKPS